MTEDESHGVGRLRLSMMLVGDTLIPAESLPAIYFILFILVMAETNVFAGYLLLACGCWEGT